MSTRADRWRRVLRIAMIESGDRVVAVGLSQLTASTAPVVIGGTGVAIWRALQGEPSMEDIVDRLAEVFETDRQQLHADVDEFLRRLEAVGLVERLGSA